MKMCPSCNVEVGEPFEHCPICQNALSISDDHDGENAVPYFPEYKGIKVLSMFFKIQLFIVLSTVLVCLFLDFMFDLNSYKHWSLIVTVWAAGLEVLISPLFKKRRVPGYFITKAAIVIVAASMICARYMEVYEYCADWQVPIIILVTLVINFILSLVDKEGNALVFSLGNFLIGVIPSIIMLIQNRHAPVLWNVCLLLSVISLLGLIIFKGAIVFNEIQKRLNI